MITIVASLTKSKKRHENDASLRQKHTGISFRRQVKVLSSRLNNSINAWRCRCFICVKERKYMVILAVCMT